MNIHESNHMTTYTVLSNFLSRLVTIDRHENPDLGTDGEIRLSLSTHCGRVQLETVASLSVLSMAQ